MKAIWNGTVIAESNETEEVEGNHYFPHTSVNKKLLQESNLHTTCVWKGEASYYTLKSGNDELENGAWYYPEPSERAIKIKDYIAFYPQVKIEE